MRTNIGAIIITYNINSKIKDNIRYLRQQVKEIIVVDNGSDEETISVLNELDESEQITIIKLNDNMGIAYALNRGIDYALQKDYDWILTLDHDSIVTENMLNEMLDVYDEMPNLLEIAMITPHHVEESQSLTKINTFNPYEFVLTEITSGALVKAEIYRHIKKYDEKLFIDLVDHEYCLELNQLGYKILKVNTACLIHNLGETECKYVLGIKLLPTNHSPLRRYYMSRNRLYIWKKYFKNFPRWVLIDVKRCISEIIKIILFENQKILKLKMIIIGFNHYFKKKWGKFQREGILNE